MIRINLLGQARPKAAKQAVPLEATVQIILGALAIDRVVVLGITYFRKTRARRHQPAHHRAEGRAPQLQQIKPEVEVDEQQKQSRKPRST